MRPSVFAKPLSQANRSLLSICCCFLIIASLWLGVCLDNSSIALDKPLELTIAETFTADLVATQPSVLDNLKDKVRNGLSAETGSTGAESSPNGLIKEKASSAPGQAEQSSEHLTQPVESRGGLVDGQTKENVAKIQGKSTNSSHAVENVMNKIKDKTN